jgi:hypothetical protein
VRKAERYTYYDDENTRIVLGFHIGQAFIHLRIRQFSASVMRKLRSIWPEIQGALAEIGYKRVIAYTPVGTEPKWFKFVGRFGFKEFHRMNGFILLGATCQKR